MTHRHEGEWTYKTVYVSTSLPPGTDSYHTHASRIDQSIAQNPAMAIESLSHGIAIDPDSGNVLRETIVLLSRPEGRDTGARFYDRMSMN